MDRAGKRLGAYDIAALLGAGGMGEVYRARDTRLDRDVALKILPADVAQDPDRLRRFEREARAASALNHPAIVAIYEVGEAGGTRYISMELVEGRTLREILEEGPMSPARALQIAAPVADGLAKAHEAGIVHRDLKPENLMVTADGYAKILDFGLAKLTERDDGGMAETRALTGTLPGSVMGTVGYMSPEQAAGGTADSRSDQFSLGVVLYEMLTRERAFARATAVETLSAIVRDDPPPLQERNPSVPPPLCWIVERCLAKAPADRYGATRDLARDLAMSRDRYSEIASWAPQTVVPAARAARLRPREIVAWCVAGALGVAAIVMAGRMRPASVATAASGIMRFPLAAPDGVSFTLGIGASPFAVSPDGRHIAMAGAGADGGRALWLRSLDTLDAHRLAGTEGAIGPFWSPDGTSIGFFASGRLKRVDLAGSDAATICPARFGGGATWNLDGTILFAPSVDSALFRVPASGGTPVAVTTLDTANDESAHLSPVFLPDGHRFVFGVIGGAKAGTYLGSLDSPEKTWLSADSSNLGVAAPDWLFLMRGRALTAVRLDLARGALTSESVTVAEGIARLGPTAAFAVSASGTLVHWSGGRQGITQLTWVRRDGTPESTLGLPGSYVNVAVSPDGRQVAADRFDPQPAIWLMNLARGTATRETFGGNYESTPVWSPDGRAFVYAAARDLPPNLFLRRIGGGTDDERLYRTRLQSFPQSWSKDGHVVAATVDPETGTDLWLIATEGDRTPTVLVRTQFAESHARISPDGRWLAYVSNESGLAEVYVTRFPHPEGRSQVSTAGGGYPVWRRDSRELYYRAEDGTLMAVAIGAGTDFTAGVPASLFKLNVPTGSPGIGTPYDVAPDGRFLVNVLIDRTSPPATAVVNWRPMPPK